MTSVPAANRAIRVMRRGGCINFTLTAPGDSCYCQQTGFGVTPFPRIIMRALQRILFAHILILSPEALSAQENKVGFRDDHTVLVGKKPVFPIGLYYCGEEFDDTSGKLLKELRDYGFNTLGYYRYGTPTWKTELDLAHKLGLKVWVRGHNGFSIDSPEIEKAAI